MNYKLRKELALEEGRRRELERCREQIGFLKDALKEYRDGRFLHAYHLHMGIEGRSCQLTCFLHFLLYFLPSASCSGTDPTDIDLHPR